MVRGISAAPNDPADGAVIVGEKEQRIAADRGKFRDIIGRPGEDAPDDEMIFVKDIGLAQQLGEFRLRARICR